MLESPDNREDCKPMKEEVQKLQEYFKRFAEEMKRKEASKIRKL